MNLPHVIVFDWPQLVMLAASHLLIACAGYWAGLAWALRK